jgi:hypothetical protein
MNIVRNTINFYIGAAIRGDHPDKWSWPARDLMYLYRRQWKGTENNMEPSIDIWVKYGMLTANRVDGSTVMVSVADLVKSIGQGEVERLLIQSRGVYLQESRDAVLDELGCPK